MAVLNASGNQPDEVTTTYRPDIDGLRAIAITAVVAYHVGFPLVTGGFVGVDIFFVLSGFLITTMLFKEAAQTGRISLQAFYARRVRRLLPASSFVLIVSIFLAYFFLIPIGDEQLKFARSAAAAALFASNIYFWKSSGSYFDGPSDQIPLLHTWSLSVEEQFYLFWPLMLIGVVRFANWRRIKLQTIVLLTLTAMFVISLAISLWLSVESPSAGFYLLTGRIWELSAGAILGVLLQKDAIPNVAKSRWIAEVIALLGLFALAVACFYFDATMRFPGWIALLPVVGTTALILAGALSNKTFVFNLLSVKPMVLIGKLSYSWYLWHWPLLAFLKLENLGETDLIQNTLAAALALVLAYLTFRFIENPIRISRPWWFSTNFGSLKAGILLILASLIAVAVLLILRGSEKAMPLSKQVSFALTDFSPFRFRCKQDGSIPLQSLKNTDCEIGNKTSANTIVVWGDSHADHWMPLILDYFQNYQIREHYMPGCPPLQGNERPRIENCRLFNDQVIDSLRIDSNVKGVILAARWPAYLGLPAISNKQKKDGPLYFDVSATSTQEALAIFTESLDRTLSTIDKIGLKTLVMAPTPEFKLSVPSCLIRKSLQSCQSTRAENDAYRDQVMLALRSVIAKHPNARLANGYDALCNEQHCKVISNNQILFLDEDHLTGSGAKHALSSMQTEFAWFARSQSK